jgi:hypothetical protein
MSYITNQPSYNTGQLSTITTTFNQNDNLEKSANITQIHQNNHTNTGDNSTIITEAVYLEKRTTKAVKTIAKLFKNSKLETKKAEIADISLLTRNQIEDEIQRTLDEKYDKKPSFSFRTDKINDLHILLEKVNTAINKESNNDSANQSYINGLQDLASTLTDVYKKLIIPLSFNIFY